MVEAGCISSMNPSEVVTCLIPSLIGPASHEPAVMPELVIAELEPFFPPAALTSHLLLSPSAA